MNPIEKLIAQYENVFTKDGKLANIYTSRGGEYDEGLNKGIEIACSVIL